MKIFYFITAHKDPDQLFSLVNSLKNNGCVICIHVDAKSNLSDFMDKIPETETVFFIKDRIKVFWSGFSQVEATLEGMRKFSGSDADFFITLSGQDFPIKPSDSLFGYLTEHKNNNFILADLTEINWKEADLRIESIRFIDFFEDLRCKIKLLTPLINKFEGLLNRSFALAGKRKLPYEYKLFGGSSWFAFNKAAINYILKTISDKPLLVSFFRKTLCSDEHFFQTIIGNSTLISTVIQDNLRFVRFLNGKSNPEILTLKDYKALIEASSFFARKFDPVVDKEIINQISNFIKK